jgi:hypothetical protein
MKNAPQYVEACKKDIKGGEHLSLPSIGFQKPLHVWVVRRSSLANPLQAPWSFCSPSASLNYQAVLISFPPIDFQPFPVLSEFS